MNPKQILMGAWLAAVVAMLCGCGPKVVTEGTEPFEQAIAAYLRDRSMDMRVTEFRSLEIGDKTATAVCKLEPSSDIYGGLGVAWEFQFKMARGEWQVAEHKRL